MTKALYIIGSPGSGKSTLMAETLEGWTAGPYTKWTTREMFGHLLERDTSRHRDNEFCVLCRSGEHGKQLGAYMGHLRPEYPGTDALSLSVAPQALLWLDALPLLGLDWVFGEGTRLSHVGFLLALHAVTDLTVVHLKVDPEVAAQRRAKRPGKTLSEQFIKVATSKADNAALACSAAGIRVLSWSPKEIPEMG